MYTLIPKKSCVVLGGDLRQVHLANLFSHKMDVIVAECGESENMFSPMVHNAVRLDAVETPPDYLILPMPAMNGTLLNAPLSGRKIHMEDVLRLIGKNTCVMAGKIDPDFQKALEERGIAYFDYLKREELAIMNAIATAEGTLEILFNELSVMIFGLPVMIIGGGRISRTLRTRLHALGAKVSVSARRQSDLAWITADGCSAVPIRELDQHIADYSVVINTVPAKVLDESVLKKLDQQALLIDLASKPGGVDFEEAKNLGIKTIWALSLPGKTAPISSGEIIYTTICNIIEEEQHGKN